MLDVVVGDYESHSVFSTPLITQPQKFLVASKAPGKVTLSELFYVSPRWSWPPHRFVHSLYLAAKDFFFSAFRSFIHTREDRNFLNSFSITLSYIYITISTCISSIKCLSNGTVFSLRFVGQSVAWSKGLYWVLSRLLFKSSSRIPTTFPGWLAYGSRIHHWPSIYSHIYQG